jgi:hypothetical protein
LFFSFSQFVLWCYLPFRPASPCSSFFFSSWPFSGFYKSRECHAFMPW